MEGEEPGGQHNVLASVLGLFNVVRVLYAVNCFMKSFIMVVSGEIVSFLL